jgi:hypothetical protein
MPRGHAIRFKVDPADIPAEKAARRLHLTPAEFEAKLSELIRRGFPAPDATTGMFCLEAIDRWRLARFPHLFPLTKSDDADQLRELARARIDSM